MQRRAFDEAGRVKPSLTDYAEAARQSARELDVPFIDLNAMSKTLYAALGVEGSKAAFASPAPGKLAVLATNDPTAPFWNRNPAATKSSPSIV